MRKLKIKKIIPFLLSFLLFLIIFSGFIVFKKIFPLFLDLAGFNQTKTYFVLLQNNYELRPSGGFLGSYAKVKIKKAKITDLMVQDIYVPDGQLQGHVDPPWPIQQAFKQGFWKLRDSNWEPDFPLATETIQWFFSKGNEEKADGFIALNFLVVRDLVKIFEPITLADYDQEISTDNFYQITQEVVEKGFFPGSTQKKDFLAALTKQLVFKAEKAKVSQLVQLIKLLKKNLEQKQILIYTNNDDFNQILDNLGWNGEVERNYQDNNKQVSDYIYIVETNLGANKANAYVEKKINQAINFENSLLKNKVTINYLNHSPQEKPDYQEFWGGPYENFLRILIPLEAENIQIKINNQDFNGRKEIKAYKDKKIKSIGFFVEVPSLSETKVEISYQKMAPRNVNKYILELQKQPGIESYPHQINFIPQKIETTKIVETDSVLKFKLKR